MVSTNNAAMVTAIVIDESGPANGVAWAKGTTIHLRASYVRATQDINTIGATLAHELMHVEQNLDTPPDPSMNRRQREASLLESTFVWSQAHASLMATTTRQAELIKRIEKTRDETIRLLHRCTE